MYDLAFLIVPCLVVNLRWNHLFDCLSNLELCTIGMREANGEDNGGLVRRNTAEEQSGMSTLIFSSDSEELAGRVYRCS